MKWIIEGQSVSMEVISNVKLEWGSMEAKLNQDGKYIEYITVDGEDVYKDYPEYLSDNTDAKTIQIHVSTLEQMYASMAQTIYDYIQQALPAIDGLSAGFYKPIERTTWETLAQFTEGMTWLQQAVQSMISVVKEGVRQSQLKQFQLNSGQLLERLSDALESKDFVLVGDVLKFDIIPLLEQLQSTVAELSGGIEGSYVS